MRHNATISRIRGSIVAVLTTLSLMLVIAPAAHAEETVPDETTAAVRITHNFWSTYFPSYFGRHFAAPGVGNHGYGPNSLYNSKTHTIRCNGANLTPNNAWHCGGRENFVVFDASFMNRASNLGDAFIYMIVAHEYGHAVQHNLGAKYRWQAGELQADCLAGAAMAGMVYDGTLTLDPGDWAEIKRSLESVADGFPWGKPGDHGSPQQRWHYFTQGWQGYAPACR